MSAPKSDPATRRTQAANSRRYDRLARLYATLEPLYLIFPPARRRAVAALGLARGETVLEIGAGSGRNLPYLIEALGPGGAVIALDASAGMLAEARRLIERRGWSNVTLRHLDATELEPEGDLDGVLFSLSYSAIPNPRPALDRAWRRLRPGARIVVMDAGLPANRLGRLLGPIAALLVKLAPGDPYSDPWRDLAAYAPVQTTRFLFGIYYVCAITKPAAGEGEPS